MNKELLYGTLSLVLVGGSGWAVTSTISNATEIATLKAKNELKTKTDDERYSEIKDMLKELRESQSRIERQLKR